MALWCRIIFSRYNWVRPLAGGGLGGLCTIIPSSVIPMVAGMCHTRTGTGRIGIVMRIGLITLGIGSIVLCSSRFDFWTPAVPTAGVCLSLLPLNFDFFWFLWLRFFWNIVVWSTSIKSSLFSEKVGAILMDGAVSVMLYCLSICKYACGV